MDGHLGTKGSRKERERWALDKLRELYPRFPEGRILACEEPDFVIEGSERRVGIEITDYVRGQGPDGSAIRRYERTADRIVRHAQAAFEGSNPTPLMVHLNWFPQRDPQRTQVAALSGEIPRIVAENVPAPPQQYVSFEPWTRDDCPVMEEYIALLSITRLKPGSRSLWSNVGAAMVELGSDEIQEAIAAKDGKVAAYLQRCDTIWLVIVADGSAISSMVELQASVCTHQFVSRFQRVLFLDVLNDRVVELEVSRATV